MDKGKDDAYITPEIDELVKQVVEDEEEDRLEDLFKKGNPNQ